MIHKFTQWFICTGQQSSVRWKENKLITGHFPRAGNGGGFAAWFVVCLQSACKQNFNAFQALHGYHRVKLNIKYFYESELSPFTNITELLQGYANYLSITIHNSHSKQLPDMLFAGKM